MSHGERFLENGYQLPMTEDGGIIGKKKLGDLTLDDATNNVGYFVELESNLELGGTEVERGFITLNNLGRHNLAHLRIGRLDPSAFWSYPTHRQILDPVQPDVEDTEEFAVPEINRIPLLPNAFSAKFFGLFDRVTGLPDGFTKMFDTTASGATIEADVIATDRLMLSARYESPFMHLS